MSENKNSILVGFIGGPCTGKTTVSKKAYEQLQQANDSCVWVKEYAGTDIRRHGPPHSEYFLFEQLRYHLGQIWFEEEAMGTADIVLTDTPVLFQYIYGLLGSQAVECERQKIVMEDLRHSFERNAKRYDILYLMKREFPYELDGVRFHTEEEAKQVDILIETLLIEYNVPFKWLTGTVQERVDQVLADLDESISVQLKLVV